MTTQISIIGLGQIGTSIGLALAKYPEKINRVGYDQELVTQNESKKMGAVDAVKFNLHSAVENTDLVLLCIPYDQVEEVLKNIGPDLRENCVIINFSYQKVTTQKWFEEHIPAGRHHIGLVPSINPALLSQAGHGIEAANADLFKDATIGIASHGSSSSQALELASDLVDLLGAHPIFLDPFEADGIELTAHILPQIVSAALLNATVGQPGWRETRRFASIPYSQATTALGKDTLESLAQTLLTNPQGAVAVLNNVIGALVHIRASIENGDQKDLEKRLQMALSDRENWQNERSRAEWDNPQKKSEIPSSGSFFKRLLLGVRNKN